MADFAKRLAADVVVAHVAEVKDEDESETDAKTRGEQTLKLMLDHLKTMGVTAEGVMLFTDDVPKAILNTAHAKECTMIVIGLTSKGAFKRLIAGDVPTAIIRAADLPVLMCPANWTGSL